MRGILSSVWRSWDWFWFTPVDLKLISVFRIIFGVGAFLFYLPRQFQLERYYYETGMLPLDMAMQVYGGKYHAFYFVFPTNPMWIQTMHAVFLLAILGLTLGFYSRFWALIAFFIHVLFLQRNFTVLWGADKIATFWFLYLILAQSDRRLSLRVWLWPKVKALKSQDLLTPVVYRLIPIQLCLVYAYSGLEKLKGPTWWYGSALWNIVTNGKMMPFDASLIAHFPIALVLGCYATLIFEIYFPMAVWVDKIRRPWLVYGVAFHFMIGLLMDLMSFSYLMCIGYVFLLQDRDWSALKNLFPRMNRIVNRI